MERTDAVPAAWQPDIVEVLLGANDISRRVTELGALISKEYSGLTPILLVVLKGSFMFASDLSRAISEPHELEFIRAKSYQGTCSTGQVQIQGLEAVSMRGRHVIVIEDIVDSGLTLKSLYQSLEGLGAASIKTCSFLEKETARRKEHVPKIDYIAFIIPDKFVVGYGLDVNQKYRQLPFLGVYKT